MALNLEPTRESEMSIKTRDDSRSTLSRGSCSEIEIQLFLKEAIQRYDEYIRLANLADVAEVKEVISPRYEWDKPIGLVITKRSTSDLF